MDENKLVELISRGQLNEADKKIKTNLSKQTIRNK